MSKNIFLYKVHFRNARSEIRFESVYRLVLSSSYTLLLVLVTHVLWLVPFETCKQYYIVSVSLRATVCTKYKLLFTRYLILFV